MKDTKKIFWTISVYNPTAIPVDLSLYYSPQGWRPVTVLPGETVDLI